MLQIPLKYENRVNTRPIFTVHTSQKTQRVAKNNLMSSWK